MRHIFAILFVLVFSIDVSVAQERPKREFRGAWIQTVYQPQYAEMDSVALHGYFTSMLDTLQATGINALLFQVRPEADAFYDSAIEPWSRFLTGEQGRAVGIDPMATLIAMCHARNIEFHAWINPYRAQCNVATKLDSMHLYNTHPEWFVSYGRQRLFDPGVPECRAHIARVVDDIVTRYDVDAIHLDDYFYPYPQNGVPFPDTASYARYGAGKLLDDWRRENVNLLVEELSDNIKARKPWVRFGISPFGIYRNNTTTPEGSATTGLQNYDDLYADVLLWVQRGWVDYILPQLYWEIGHKAACYETLVHWWNRNVFGSDCHLYIGQDLKRSLDAPGADPRRSQLAHKMMLTRYLDNVSGVCFWSGYLLLDNYKECRTLLQRDFFSSPALVPAYAHIDDRTPAAVKKLRTEWTAEGFLLRWNADKSRNAMRRADYYCIYRFEENEPVDLSRADALVGMVRDTRYRLPYADEKKKYIYVVTSVNRLHNEGEPKKITVKL